MIADPPQPKGHVSLQASWQDMYSDSTPRCDHTSCSTACPQCREMAMDKPPGSGTHACLARHHPERAAHPERPSYIILRVYRYLQMMWELQFRLPVRPCCSVPFVYSHALVVSCTSLSTRCVEGALEGRDVTGNGGVARHTT